MVPNSNNIKRKKNNPFWDQFSGGLLHIGKEFESKMVSFRVAGVYILIGSLWVLLSDKLLEKLVQDKQTLTLVSMAKGWVYILITGMLIFGLVYSALRRIHGGELEIIQGYEELATAYEELETAHEELTASEEELRQQFDALMESKKKLAESEERYRLVLEATNDAIWDEQEDKRYFSDRWFGITGYTREELDGIEDWQSLIHPDDYAAAKAIMIEHQQLKTPYYCCEYRFRKKDGQYIWIQARGKALFDKLGNVYRMAGSHSDITKLKEYQQELHYIAYHDQLTSLPNRLALYEEISRLLSFNSDCSLALLFIDVDNFKFINNTLGHAFGDQLIKLLGERLACLLKKDWSLHRPGGDAFIIVIKDIKKQEDVEVVAAHILEGFKEPFAVGNNILHINISIGVSLYPEHGKDINELLRCADIAMYRAKEAGRNRHMVYTQPMDEIVAERMLIEKHLRTALENNEFELYYQPQFDIGSKRISGLEALLRWNSRELGFVSPLKFIKISEETHLIMPLGAWVLKKACAFIKKLHEQGYTDMVISVNVSVLQLFTEGLCGFCTGYFGFL